MQKRKFLFSIVVFFAVMLLGCTSHVAQADRNGIRNQNASKTEETQKMEDIQPEIEAQKEEMPEMVLVEDDDFVEVKEYIPDIVVELKYASTDNFTRQIIYGFSDAYLRYGTVKKMIQVQDTLREEGLSLKIWDAFRPVSAQFVLWEVCPDSTYVANPNKGFSSHSRGNTVDITIVNKDGEEIVMPTEFDDFSKLADRDYSDCSKAASENAIFLENLMEQNGFKGYYGEWWHFTDTDTYPVEEVFQP